jgi:cell shape-determining protein MreC
MKLSEQKKPTYEELEEELRLTKIWNHNLKTANDELEQYRHEYKRIQEYKDENYRLRKAISALVNV